MSFPFDSTFQRGLLGLAARSPTFLRHIRPLLTPDLFSNKGHQAIAGMILAHFDRTGNPPAKGDLFEALRILEEPDWLKAGVGEEMREMYEDTAVDEGDAESKVRTYASSAAVRATVSKLDDYLARGGLGDFLGDVKRAAAISTREAPCQPYEEGIEERAKAYSSGEARKGAVSTGLLRLDGILGGGPAPGELAVALGLLGTGKSQFLVNVGAGAMMAGKKVMHVSLEMGYLSTLKRYDQRLSGKKARELTTDDMTALRTKWSGLLDVVVAPAYRLPVSAIESRIERMAPDARPSLLIVDYGMLLSGEGSEEPGAESRRHVLGRVYADLRALAIERHLAVWTAIQANRKGYEAPILTSQHVAECFEALQHADITISLNQTQSEVLGKKLRIWVEKNRDESSKTLVNCVCDWSRSLLLEEGSAG